MDSSLQQHRRDFLRTLHYALELLELDAGLIEQGAQFFYVVDFTAIFSYMHKKTASPIVVVPGELPERTFARQQIALWILFNKHLRPLVLIPPYSAELRNHLHLLATQATIAQSDAYKEKLSRLVNTSDSYRNYMSLKTSQSRESLDGEQRKALREIGEVWFPELRAAIECISVEALETLRYLINGRLLCGLDDTLPQCADIDYSSNGTDEWYKQIFEWRHKIRAIQSHTDAMACTFLEVANQRLNSENKIVVFVSPSRSVEDTLRKKPLIRLQSGKTIDAARNLTYCLLAFTHMVNDRYDKAQIKTNLETIGSLLKVYDSPIPVDWREDAKKAALEWERCENMLVMKDPAITKHSVKKAASDADAQLLLILEKLHQTMSEGKEDFAGEIESRLSDLRVESIALSKAIPGDLEAFQAIKVTSGRKGVRVQFPGLYDELPLSILFNDKDVVHLAQQFQRLKSERYSEESILKFRKYIVDTSSLEEATPENHLLAGYILALEGKYEAAISELGKGRQKADEEGNRELIFISAMVYRKLYRADEAQVLLESVLPANNNDPRLNLEYAKVMCVRWRDDVGSRKKIPYLDIALESLRRASTVLRMNRDKMLEAQVENVTAYVYTERAMRKSASIDDIHKAEIHIKNMQELIPEKEWPGRFFDTRAYWYYAGSEMIPGRTMESKKKLLESARVDIDHALKSDSSIGARVSVRRQHEALIEEALSRINK